MKLPSYPRYKPSGVEWLGDVPEHWERIRLGFEADLLVPMRDKPEDLTGTIPWVRIEDFTGKYLDGSKSGQGVSEDTVRSMHLKVFPAGTVLCSCSCSMGATAIARTDLVSNQTFIGIVPSRRILAEYLFYALGVAKGHLDSVATGAIQQYLSRSDFSQLRFVIPCEVEQRAIATYLDAETGRIEGLVAKKRELIERLKEKRSALISRTVTCGLPPAAAHAAGLPVNPPMKDSGIEWLDHVPAHWKIGPLKGLSENARKSFTDGDWVELPFITDEGVRLLQTGNVGIGRYKEQGFRYVTEESFALLGCTEVKPGDVLICRLDGPVGRACLAPDLGVRMITSVDNTILKPHAEVSPRFIVYLLSSAPWLAWIDALCRVGGGFRIRISRSMLGNIRVPIPPTPEQHAIAAYLDAETAKLDALVAKVEEAVERLQEYRSALITAAVTGKIDVRGAVTIN